MLPTRLTDYIAPLIRIILNPHQIKIMYKHILRLFTLALLLGIFTACMTVGSEDKEVAFKRFLPTENINDSIQLYLPESFKPLIKRDHVSLVLKNRSQDIIRFPPPNQGIQLFVYNIDKKKWVEIGNSGEYHLNGSGNLGGTSTAELPGWLLYPKGDSYIGEDVTSAFPILDTYTLPITIRYMILGTIYRDNKSTDQKVAAYLDVLIER